MLVFKRVIMKKIYILHLSERKGNFTNALLTFVNFNWVNVCRIVEYTTRNRKNCRQFLVTISPRLSSRRKKDEVKDEQIAILGRYRVHFIKEQENLV